MRNAPTTPEGLNVGIIALRTTVAALHCARGIEEDATAQSDGAETESPTRRQEGRAQKK